MTLSDITSIIGGGTGIGIIVLVLLSLVEVSKIQINPWQTIGKALSKGLTGELQGKVDKVQDTVDKTKQQLDEHIRIDDERDADQHRQNILRFNNELLRDIPHTKEDFSEILAEIDHYEKYCEKHPEYRNNRAVHAVAHIEKVYDERLEKHDFL